MKGVQAAGSVNDESHNAPVTLTVSMTHHAHKWKFKFDAQMSKTQSTEQNSI